MGAVPATFSAAPQQSWTLGGLWSTDGALIDSNGDGFADATRLQVTLGDPGSDAQVAAAANLLARLGFETMSIDLPLAAPAGGPRIHLADPPAAAAALAVPDHQRGYVLATADGRIDVWGDDADALASAAVWLAGRAPRLWDADSPTLSEAATLLLDWAAAHELGLRSATVIGVVVEADQPGVKTLLFDVEATAEPAASATALTAAGEGPQIATVEQLSLRIRGYAGGPVVVPSAGDAAVAGGSAPGGGREALDLADIYTPAGLLGDSNGDEIPDRLDAVLSSSGVAPGAVTALAARIGLESAGVRIPAAVAPEGLEGGPDGTRVLIGAHHPATARLVEEGTLPALDTAASGGQIAVVREAFGDDVALVVRGDDAGVEAATRYVAETAPYLSRRGKDAPELATVANDLRRFLGRRTPAGQAAAAIDIARDLVAELPEDAADRRLVITVDRVDPGLTAYLGQQFGASVDGVAVHTRDVQAAPEIWRLATDLESEPDQLRASLEGGLGVVGKAVVVEARISEPRAVRERLRREIRADLLGRGASAAQVEILPAYKQGFGWIEERVLPLLRGAGVDEITIEYARNVPPASWPYQAMQTPSRWLLEIFPIDEVLTRELGLPLEAIHFIERVAAAGEPEAPIYTLTARAGGRVVVQDDFHPALVERPYFDAYPAYERVRVAAGWVRVLVDGEAVLDRHLPSDLERVWDLYQTQVLPTLHDYTMRLHEGAPRAAYAPHFGELRAAIQLSEPDRELGVDKERIAPMEALHEELYFGTLHFFDLMGRVASGSALGYPGRVIPIVEPRSDGGAGHVVFTLSGFESPVPRVEVRYTAGGRQRVIRRDLPPLEVTHPTTRGLRITDPTAVAEMDFWIPVDAHADSRAELKVSYPARQLDSAWVVSERAQGALVEIAALRTAGVYPDALAYEHTPEIAVAFGTGFVPASDDVVTTLAAATMAIAAPEPQALIAASGATHIVQWQTPMPPAEAHSILAVMAQEFDAATVYRLGGSYLGQEIWGLDLMAPLPGTHWSQAKATALKPTVVYSARQHANEVSSTSHVLRTAQLLLDDPDWQDALQRINVVIHPITNPDGAQLAFDLHQLTPDHMLHAGYLGSLGVDVTSGAGTTDPIYPETNVRDQIWSTWLPDIFLNPHGYPSHEWVQPFSEYAGWVRHRTTQSRDWWGMRGWFMPGFAYLDDPDYPRHKEHAFRIRDAITTAINGVPDIAALNKRAYARYRRYGHDADAETFRLNFADDVLIYTSLKGSRAGGRGWVGRNPKVTIWSGSTEAPDETAYGDWLELVASAGLAWDQAILRYLLDLEHPVERTLTSHDGATSIKLYRERPGTVPGEDG
jgi:hypothetical protein